MIDNTYYYNPNHETSDMRGDNEESGQSVHNETKRDGPLKQRGEAVQF